MARMTSWVRTYTLRDLLDSGFDLFKERFTTLLLAALIPYMLVVVYTVLMRHYVFPGNLVNMAALKESDPFDLITRFFSPAYFIYTAGVWLLASVAMVLANIAQCRIAAWHALGEPVNLWRAFRRMGKPFWSYLLVSLLAGWIVSTILGIALFVTFVLAGLLGSLALLIGSQASQSAGVFAQVVTVFLVAATLLTLAIYLVWTPLLEFPVSLAHDDAGPFTALGRSFKCAFSNFKTHYLGVFLVSQTCLIFLLLSLAASALLRVGASYFSPTLTEVLDIVFVIVGQCMFLGLFACFQTLVHVDGRCRKDHLELRVMAQEIGLGAELDAAFSPAMPAGPAMPYPDYARAAAPTAASSSPVAPAPGPGGAMPPPAAPVVPVRATAFPDYSAPPPADVTATGERDAG